MQTEYVLQLSPRRYINIRGYGYCIVPLAQAQRFSDADARHLASRVFYRGQAATPVAVS